MRTTALSILVMFGLAANVVAAEIGKVPWNQSSVDALGVPDKASVARFINSSLPTGWMEVPLYSVAESGWARVGSGRYDFLVLLDISGRGYSNKLMIYNQNNAGSVKTQEIGGWKMGNLKQIVRDINGDGADQLIVPKELGRGGIWFPLLDMPAWPAIYRLDHGRYVEASRYFPVFYDTQVLPRLNEQIREAQARISREPFQQRTIAVLEMERDKVLRVLGRDPVAGLAQAYHWMNSEDPQVLQCAISTFSDIGGHDAELRIAQRALEPAIQREQAERRGG